MHILVFLVVQVRYQHPVFEAANKEQTGSQVHGRDNLYRILLLLLY